MKRVTLFLMLALLAVAWGCQQQTPAPASTTTPATTPGPTVPAGTNLTPQPQAPQTQTQQPIMAGATATNKDASKPGKPIGALAPGDLVWAMWSDGYYYPATITNIAGGKYTVIYEDTYNGTLGPNDLRQWQIQVGMVLESKWSGGGWWKAKITTVMPTSVGVQFLDDNSRETHSLADLRLKP